MDFIHESNVITHQGILLGKVIANHDDDHKGMIKVEYHAHEDGSESNWMRVISPYAGKERGFYFHPEIGDEVAVAFIGGDLNNPCCIGSFWNNEDSLPKDVANEKNTAKTIVTKSKIQISFSDESGKESIKIITPKKHEISIDDEKDLITIKVSDNEIKIDGSGKKISLSSNDIEIKAKGKISLSAANIEVKADSKLTFSAATAETDAKSKLGLSGLNVEIKAKAALKAEASGITTVKGAMVKING